MTSDRSFVFSDDVHVPVKGAFTGILRSGISDHDQLMLGVADALKFPGYFGENWNALFDCLKDFGWIEERDVYLVHLDVPGMEADDLRTYLDILRHAASIWKDGEAHRLIVVFPAASEAKIRKLLR